MVLNQVADLNRREGRLGSLGVVIGATRDAPRFDLATLSGPYLVPGVGAQGAGRATSLVCSVASRKAQCS